MTELNLCPTCGAPLPSGTGPEACPRCLMRAGFASTGGAGALGSGPSIPSPEELAADLPQLEILELVGRGGMGAVYKARQKSLDRIVAVKLLTVGADADPAFAERFEREARALASLSHPNIVAVYDSGRAGERYYLVMEFVDGTDLRQMERAARIDPREALAIVAQVCGALQYAHDRGIVHRDIKPENILVDRKGEVKIADFGLAKLLGRPADSYALTRSDQAMGTLHYMAPEQVERPLTVDHRADIYSLGVVFYELLTGELPIGRFDPPSKKYEVDVRLDEVVLKALEKDPPRRYQHASEVKTEVEGIARGPAVASGATAGHGGFMERHGKRSAALWIAGVGALLSLPLALLAYRFLVLGHMSARPGILGVALILGLGLLAGIVFLVLFLVRGAGSRDGGARPAWPWVLGAILFAILIVPAGCGAVALTFAFLGASSYQEAREVPGHEPFEYDAFGEPAPVPVEPAEPEPPATEPDEPR